MKFVLFLFLSTFLYAAQLELLHKPLSKTEFLKKYRSLQEINLEDLPKELHETKPSQSSSRLIDANWSFRLTSAGIEILGTLQLDFQEKGFQVLPRSWIPAHISNARAYKDRQGNLWIHKDTENKSTTVTLSAFYPNTEHSSFVQIKIPWISHSVGKVRFDHGKEFERVRWTLGNPEPLMQIPGENKELSSLSTVSEITVEAQLPVKRSISKPVIPKPVVKKTQKSMVFVDAQHNFEVSSKEVLYKMEAKIRISRTPVQTLKLNLPSGFQLETVHIKQGHYFRRNANLLQFSKPVHDQLDLVLNGRYQTKETEKSMRELASKAVGFEGVEEDRGYMSFSTPDVVEIQEVLFEDVESIQRLDATELPREMTAGTQNPILWAFRYLKPDSKFQLKTRTFESYALQTVHVSSFHGHSSFNSDLSAIHRYTLRVKSQNGGPFNLPLPKTAKLKYCKLNGREIRAYQDANGTFSVTLPKSPAIASQANRSLNFIQNNQALSKLKEHTLEVSFHGFDPKDKKSEIEFHLPHSAQNIHYQFQFHKSIEKAKVQSNMNAPKGARAGLVHDLWPNSKQGSQATLLFFLGLILLFLAYEKTRWFPKLFLSRTWRERRHYLFGICGVLILFFSVWNLSTSVPVLKPKIHGMVQQPDYGSFVPYGSNSYRFVSSQKKELLTLQGLEKPFRITVDFSSSSEPLNSSSLHFLYGLLAFIPVFFLRRRKLNLTLVSLVLSYLLLHIAYGTGKIVPGVLSPWAYLVYAFLWSLLLELYTLKRAFFTVAALSLLLSPVQEAMELPVYNYSNGEKTHHFVETRHFKALQSHQKMHSRPSDKNLAIQRANLSFQKTEKSLLIQYFVDLSDLPVSSNVVKIPIPVKNALATIDKTQSASAQCKLLHNRSTNTLSLVKESPDCKQLIVNLNAELSSQGEWSGRMEFPGIILASVNLVQSQGFEWILAPNQYQRVEDSFYHLDSSRTYSLLLKRTVEEKVVEKDIVKTRSILTDRMTLEASHQLQIEENFLLSNSSLEVEITGSGHQELFIDLPPDLKVKNVRCDATLKDWFVDEEKDILVLKFQEEESIIIGITVSGELRFTDKQGDLGSFFLRGASKVKNLYIFEADQNLGFEVQPNQEMITTLIERDSEQLAQPVFIQEIRQRPGNFKGSLKIKTIPRQIVHTVQAFIDSLKATAYLHYDRNLYTRYQLQIRNNGQQFLKVGLQEGERILTAKINGEKAYLGLEADKVLIPMKMVFNDKNEIEPFFLEFTTVRKARSEPDLLVGLPDFSIRAASVMLELSLGFEARLQFVMGTLSPVKNTSKMEFLGLSKQARLRSMQDIPLDIPVFRNNQPHVYQAHFTAQDKGSPFVRLIVMEPSPDHKFSFVIFILCLIACFLWPNPNPLRQRFPKLIKLYFGFVILASFHPSFTNTCCLGFLTGGGWMLISKWLQWSSQTRRSVKELS